MRARAQEQCRKNRKLFAFAWALSLLLSGCMMGPNYKRPAVQTPTAFRDLSNNQQAQSQAASLADLPWWQVFQDPQLQELIRTALKQNYDLQIAIERINQARAQVAVTRSSLFPQVQTNSNFAGGRKGNFRTKFNFLNLTADAAFQLDFFGKLRRATEAARAELLATEDARQTVILTLVSDVASDYFALLDLDLQLQIAHETVKTQEDSVKLTTFRVEHGVATKLDVLQAQQSGDQIELFYEDAPATTIRATVGRLLTDRDEEMGIEVEDYIACWMEITIVEPSDMDPKQVVSLGTDFQCRLNGRRLFVRGKTSC